jgi:hypothetical protein
MVIPTYKRPVELGQLLDSFADNERARKNVSSVTIFDDAEDEEGRQATYELASRCKTEHALDVDVVGWKEKFEFIDRVAGSDKEIHEILEFALKGMTELHMMKVAGRNRNSVIVHNAGRKFLSCDDDIKFNYKKFLDGDGIVARRNPGYKNAFAGMYFTPDDWPKVQGTAGGNFFKNFGKLIAPYDGDAVKEFENLLGSTQDAGMIDEDAKKDIEHLEEIEKKRKEDALIKDRKDANEKDTKDFNISDSKEKDKIADFMKLEKEGPVIAAMGGIWGGRWFGSPHGMLLGERELFKYYWKDKDSYLAAIKDPRCFLAAPNRSFSRDAYLVTTQYGVDATNFLPPYVPHVRNEDGIWILMLTKMYPASLIGRMEFAVEHNTRNHEPFPQQAFTWFEKIQASPLIEMIVKEYAGRIKADDPVTMLTAIGKELITLSNSSKRQLDEFMTFLQLYHFAQGINGCTDMIRRSGGKPPYWVEDVKKRLENLRVGATEDDGWIPWDFRPFGIRAEKIFLKYIRRIGELLIIWPDVWKKCLENNHFDYNTTDNGANNGK